MRNFRMEGDRNQEVRAETQKRSRKKSTLVSHLSVLFSFSWLLHFSSLAPFESRVRGVLRRCWETIQNPKSGRSILPFCCIFCVICVFLRLKLRGPNAELS